MILPAGSEMKIEISSKALKFFETLDKKTQNKVREKLKELITSIERDSIIPLKNIISFKKL